MTNDKTTPRLVVTGSYPLSNPVLRHEATANDPIKQHTVAQCFNQKEAQRLADAWNEYDRLRRIEKLARELAQLVTPFLADLSKRPRSSASMQRIGSDADSLLDKARELDAEIGKHKS